MHLDSLFELDPTVGEELLCKAHLAVFAERKRGFTNQPFHDEWCDLAMRVARLCVVAPREHAKSETFAINQVAWRSVYWPGWWTYVFSQTGDQGNKLLDRIDAAVGQVAPRMVENKLIDNRYTRQYANGSRVDAAGAAKAVRGAHPDLVVGDDVLSDETTGTANMRSMMRKWWFGTVAGMAHPGTMRVVGGQPVWFPPTQIHLVGTPFHAQDLLMGMRTNPLYKFYRYAAEFEATVPGTCAVEVAA